MPMPIRSAMTSLLLASTFAASASDVIRHKIPDSDFPISAAVEIPAGKTLVFLSGMVSP